MAMSKRSFSEFNNKEEFPYFIDNGSVPYVDVEEFIMLLEGALDTTIIEFVYDFIKCKNKGFGYFIFFDIIT